MSICVYGLKRSGSTNIGRPLIAPYRFKKCDNLQIPYISSLVHRDDMEVILGLEGHFVNQLNRSNTCTRNQSQAELTTLPAPLCKRI